MRDYMSLTPNKIQFNNLLNSFLTGTVLRTLPRLFLGYGKLLITIVNTDSYVINSENYRNLNDSLKNGCMLVQGYGIRNPATVHYEAFPFNSSGSVQFTIIRPCSGLILIYLLILDITTNIWSKHKAVEKLSQVLNLTETCGYVTFVNTGVPDIGCEDFDINVHLKKPIDRSSINRERRRSSAQSQSRTSASDAASITSEETVSTSIIGFTTCHHNSSQLQFLVIVFFNVFRLTNCYVNQINNQ